MALPTSMTTSFRRARTGVVLGIHPSTQRDLTIELRRSTQSSTASTDWFTDYLTGSSAFDYEVALPLSTRTYYFQARHTGRGYSNGDYTPIVSAKPTKIGAVGIGGGIVPIVRGKNAAVEIPNGNVWLTSAQTVKVGTLATTATLAKTIRIPYSQLVPNKNAATWIYNGAVFPNTTGLITGFETSIVLQRGVQITGFASRGYRSSTGANATCTVKFVKYSSNGGQTVIATNTHTAAGFSNKTSTANQTVTSETYGIDLTLKSTSPSPPASTNCSRFLYADITYLMPSYDKAV